ncbi:hypothetical protein UCYN_04170 [Candidatus Atelocyanobacterium thalassa isolate ALOHA]|uniref:Uncharacterized protein n=1 Tax=Atelocyanobacterium thalassa (isolate ALOHA) TaxID=1453429 RepID=D3ENV4_ATETH|nr:hypothetical protein UCYN_04170 [Candidatus Atelocyanobacterium thalassa isolate ALOHA]
MNFKKLVLIKISFLTAREASAFNFFIILLILHNYLKLFEEYENYFPEIRKNCLRFNSAIIT